MILVVLMSCLLCNGAISLILSYQYGSDQYRILSGLTEYMTANYPRAEDDLIKIIKSGTQNAVWDAAADSTVLSSYGYTAEHFAGRYYRHIPAFLLLSVPSFLIFLYVLYRIIRRNYRLRITDLTARLARINRGENSLLELSFLKEDELSKLEDEIYKTVTFLRQTRENAVREHKNLADSLADISHQIKTPVSSISLMTQLLEAEPEASDTGQIIKQIQNQTTHLEQLTQALLTLSRIDAGTLKLKKSKVDIYTLLQLSLESITPLILQKEIQLSLPNHPGLDFTGDLDWSMEAFINLFKNCAQHIPEKGFIYVEYSANPLYVQIEITDNGPGFAQKDLPHIFERFYRGENAITEGTGIGLALAKSLIELQNGVIHAKNHPSGAGFTIRFYSH